MGLLESSKLDVNRATSIILSGETEIYGNPQHIDIVTGHVEPGTLSAGDYPCGLMESVPINHGVATDLVGDGTLKVTTVGGLIVNSLTVVGASAATDRRRPVYLSAAAAYTLTKPANTEAVGFVYEWKTGTTCDVYFFDIKDTVIKSNVGERAILDLGTFGTVNTGLEAANAATLKTLIAQRPFKIISLHGQCAAFDVGSVAGAQTLTCEIGGVATTGGILTIGFANNDAVGDMGVAIDATAITALNTVNAGVAVELTLIAGGTGFTASKAGIFNFHAIIEYI